MTYRIHTFDTPGFVKMEGVGRIHYYIMYGAGIVWVTFSSMYTMPYPHYYEEQDVPHANTPVHELSPARAIDQTMYWRLLQN
jgi:hypothetical protein